MQQKLFRWRGQLSQLHLYGRCCRQFSSVTPSQGTLLFDRNLKKKQKQYAAALQNSAEYDYFRSEIATGIVSRLLDLDRKFPKALEIGANSGQVYKQLIRHIVSFPNDKVPGNDSTHITPHNCV